MLTIIIIISLPCLHILRCLWSSWAYLLGCQVSESSPRALPPLSLHPPSLSASGGPHRWLPRSTWYSHWALALMSTGAPWVQERSTKQYNNAHVHVAKLVQNECNISTVDTPRTAISVLIKGDVLVILVVVLYTSLRVCTYSWDHVQSPCLGNVLLKLFLYV